ncbi:hypothetical protein [Desulfuromonas thiophila]|uniref:hypothetical protein n=1 Tax=Desulfuromonas thiophila TaxID=57664 RepID=UPI0024A8708E|nr:hypothetical protein [Desulfuromonas thiophila]
METLKIPIRMLRRHEEYEAYGAITAKIDYLLRDPELIQPAAIEVVLEALPIIAVPSGKKWKYISGHRTAIISASVLGSDAIVPVQVVPNPGSQRIRLYIAVDIIASPIITGVCKKSNLGELLGKLRHLDSATHEKLFVAMTQKSFSSALSVTKETVFRKKAKK